MWRALVGNLGVFGLLFGLHIVFASLDLELAFSIVALAITVQVVLFGPFSVVLEGARRRLQRRRTNRVGFAIALPLSFGLAWAYGGMVWSPSVVLVVVGTTVVFHLLLDRRLTPGR